MQKWSYTVAGDARPDFTNLDVYLQEAVLDALDALCDGSGPLPPALPDGRFLPVPHAREDGALDLVVVRLLDDEQRNLLIVAGVREA